MIKFFCKQCLKEFYDYPSDKRVFCCKVCFSAWKRKNIQLLGGLFKKGHANLLPKGFIPSNKGKVNWGICVKCPNCKKIFRTQKYRILRSLEVCCSKKCSSKIKDHGKTTATQRLKASKKYKEWRQKVYERDDYTCQECGQRGGKLNPHHIKPKLLYPKLILDINNGLTLCEECHRKTDSYGIKVHKVASEWTKEFLC